MKNHSRNIEKKKILFVDHDPIITGSTVSLRYLVDGFSKQNFELILLTPKEKKYHSYFDNYNVRFVKWDYKVNLELHLSYRDETSLLFELKEIVRLSLNFIKGIIYSYRYLKNIAPDLIYINEYVLSQFTVSGKLLKIPTVTHIRSPFLKGTFGLRRYLFANLLKYFNNYVFAITQEEANQILSHIQNTKDNVKVVREFLSEEDYYHFSDITEVKNSYEIPLDKKILLMIGGIEPIKGSIVTIEAFSKLASEYDNAYLIIAGWINNNEDYNKKCFEIIEKNQLEDRIKIIDFVKDIKPLIACADVVISSFSMTHFSRPVIEAWAQRKAVVSSDVPHALEIIKDGENGLLFEANNSDSLYKVLSDIMNDKYDLNALGNNGYSLVKEKYSAKNNVDEIVAYCSEIIK